MTRIKICGMTTAEHALAAAYSGADFIGIVFAPSTRQISEQKATEIIEAVRTFKPHLLVAGVFVNSAADEVNSIADRCRLDWVQLSGDEDWEYCSLIERPIIKAIHIFSEMTAEKVLTIAEKGCRIVGRERLLFLLDTGIKNAYGGTGVKFNWDRAREIIAHYPVIIAGGLNPENVADLVKKFSPWGVDVSSGVEINGRKDGGTIDAFIKAVKSSEKE